MEAVHVKYIVKPNLVTRISETSGMIQNTDQINSVEICKDANFKNSFILYPLQAYSFNTQLYIKCFDICRESVEIWTANISLSGGSSGSDSSDEGGSDDEDDDITNEEIDRIIAGTYSPTTDDDITDAEIQAIVNGDYVKTADDDELNDSDFDDILGGI